MILAGSAITPLHQALDEAFIEEREQEEPNLDEATFKDAPRDLPGSNSATPERHHPDGELQPYE